MAQATNDAQALQLQAERKAAALFGMAESFGQELKKNAVRLWLTALQPYTAEQVEAGVMAVVQTWEWKTLPTLAELLKRIRQASGAQAPVNEEDGARMQAEAEWGVVLRAVRDVGSYGSPKLRPETREAVRHMGGWQELCSSMTGANRDFKRRDFLQLWQDCARAGRAMSVGAGAVVLALGTGPGFKLRSLPGARLSLEANR